MLQILILLDMLLLTSLCFKLVMLGETIHLLCCNTTRWTPCIEHLEHHQHV